MKKWLFYVLVLAGIPVLSFGGFGGEDVGKLSPVHVIAVLGEEEQVQLLTDTGELGMGKDVRQAIRNMEERAPARVFLDTADYLLLKPGAEIWLPELLEHLRPSCHLCYLTAESDLEEAGKYLQIHEPDLTLSQYEAGERELPYLISDEGRLKLVQP